MTSEREQEIRKRDNILKDVKKALRLWNDPMSHDRFDSVNLASFWVKVAEILRDCLVAEAKAVDSGRAELASEQAHADRLYAAVEEFGGVYGHSFACEFRTSEVGWKRGDPPVIRCQCGLGELEEALAEHRERRLS